MNAAVVRRPPTLSGIDANDWLGSKVATVSSLSSSSRSSSKRGAKTNGRDNAWRTSTTDHVTMAFAA
jgi:hypothetical protein